MKTCYLILLSILMSQFGIAQVKHLDFQTLSKSRVSIQEQEAQIPVTGKKSDNGNAFSILSQNKLNNTTAIYFQDFENFTPGDMIFIDNDSLLPNEIIQPIYGEGSNWIVDIIDESGNYAASSTSWLIEGDSTADDWMITPSIYLDAAAADPYFLIWDAGSATPFAPDGYEVLISTTGTELEDFTPIFSIDAENEYPLTSRSLNLTELGYTGNVYIAFHHNSTNRFILMVDNIMVTEISQDPNVGLSNLYTSSFAAYGQEMHVAGAFKNYSGTNITSLKINWTINGFGPYEEEIDSLDIPLMALDNFILTIPKQISATTVQVVGANEVKTWVSEVNATSYTGLTNDTISCEFELSPDYAYFMNFDLYVDGDMTMVDNDTVVPLGIPSLNYWNLIQEGPDDFVMISVSIMSGAPVDKWMITPPIEITNGDFLFWEAKGRTPAYDQPYEIMISATGVNLGDFTSLGVFHETSDSWTLRNFDLSAYDGQTIYIAFRDIANSQAAILVNNIEIKPFAGLDLGITKISTPRFIVANEANKVAGRLKNELGDIITSYTLNYQVNYGDIVSQSYTGLSIPSLASVEFEMTEPLILTENGVYPVSIWISEVNDTVDQNTANDTVNITIQVVPFFPERKLVIEELTGTWCGWCVRGIVFMDSIYNVNPTTVIPIAVHGSDPMQVDSYIAGIQSFPGFGGFPATIIERKFLSDPISVFDDYDANIDAFGGANLNLDVTIDVNRNLTASVSATFAATLNGDYRFALVITEDSVHGSTPDYGQTNYYSGGANGPMGGFENLPDHIPADDMYYNFVARAILGGFTGQENSLPVNIEVNSTHTYTFNYTIPAEYNIDELKAIVLLIDTQTGEVMNGNDFNIGWLGISEFEGSNIEMYPNPASQVVNVSDVKNSNVQLVNIMGQVVYSTKCLQDNAQINVSSYTPGIYFVRIIKGQKVGTGKVVIK